MNVLRTWLCVAAAAVNLLLAAATVQANNLVVTNTAVRGRDDTTAYVDFDISWENSWRYTNVNHDAAWVFFKVQEDGGSEWQHGGTLHHGG